MRLYQLPSAASLLAVQGSHRGSDLGASRGAAQSTPMLTSVSGAWVMRCLGEHLRGYLGPSELDLYLPS